MARYKVEFFLHVHLTRYRETAPPRPSCDAEVLGTTLVQPIDPIVATVAALYHKPVPWEGPVDDLAKQIFGHLTSLSGLDGKYDAPGGRCDHPVTPQGCGGRSIGYYWELNPAEDQALSVSSTDHDQEGQSRVWLSITPIEG